MEREEGEDAGGVVFGLEIERLVRQLRKKKQTKEREKRKKSKRGVMHLRWREERKIHY